MAHEKDNPVKIPPPPMAFYDFNKSAPDRLNLQMPGGPSMTRQEFAEECDINTLMKRYENRDIGAIMRAAGEPAYIDFTEMPTTLMDYMQLVQDADNAFMTLPATVRREFDNDPTQFVEFASKSENLDQLRDWGLAPPAAQPGPAPSQGGATPHSSPLDVTVRTDTKDSTAIPSKHKGTSDETT